MPWYGREFYSDENVLVLTLEQEAAYLRLLWLCWQEGSIPSEPAKLAAICKNTAPQRFERHIWPAICGMFASRDDGRLVHRKVEMLRDVKDAFRAKCSEAGKIGNAKRWGNDRVPDGNAITEASHGPDENPNRVSSLSDFRLPISDFRQERTNICASGDARLIDPPLDSINDPPFGTTEPDALFPGGQHNRGKNERPRLQAQQDSWFTEWWAVYWLKKSRKRAREAFGRHVTTEARFQQVMEATRAQSAEMLSREPQHRPHGATWLNGERWADEPAEAPKQETAVERAVRMAYGDKAV